MVGGKLRNGFGSHDLFQFLDFNFEAGEGVVAVRVGIILIGRLIALDLR